MASLSFRNAATNLRKAATAGKIVRNLAYEGGREIGSRLFNNNSYDIHNPLSKTNSFYVASNPVKPQVLSGTDSNPYTDNGQTTENSSYANGGNGGNGGTGSAGNTDPRAEERAAFQRQLPGAIANIGQNARDAFGGAGRNLRGGAESLFNTINQGQRAINQSRENVELNRLSGVKDILGFVRNGLQQGGKRLANMNASESSAAGELGRAFGTLGGERMRGVGNKAFLENRGINTNQEQLDLQRGQGRTDWARTRDELVSNIGQQIRGQLAELDSQAQGLGITDRIAIDQEKQRLIDEGLGQLNEVDTWLQGQLGTVNPQDDATTRTNAIALQQGGTGNITPFDFGEFQGIQQLGPAIDQLPLFTRNRRVERGI